jgi:uncharacterized membrane protein
MRFPSFIKLPDNKKFRFEPRYYDPIREEIQIRTKNIEIQLSQESNEQRIERISFEWQRRSRQVQKASMLQLIILVTLITTLVLYFYFGNTGFYVVLSIFALAYIYYRIKKVINNKRDSL